MTRPSVVLFKGLETGNSSITAVANESEVGSSVDVHFFYGNGEGRVASLYLDDMMKGKKGITDVLRWHWEVPLWEARQVAERLDEDGWISVWTVMSS